MGGLTERIMEELVAIGFAKATDYLFTRGDQLVIRSTAELPAQAGAAIASIERSSTGLKLKFYDKLKALEMLGKCCGMFDGNGVRQEENNLLEAVLQATKEAMVLDDIPEAQQEAAADYDLVEPPGS